MGGHGFLRINAGAAGIAGGLIRTARGSEIETLRPGDKVYTWNESTGKRSIRKVTRTFVRSMAAVVAITLTTGEVLHATEEHAFRVVEAGAGESVEKTAELNGEWTTAIELRSGDRLVSQEGEAVYLLAKEVIREPRLVYNLEIGDYHTYFVGSAGMLVHNVCQGQHHLIPRGLGSKMPHRHKSLSKYSSATHTKVQTDLNAHLAKQTKVIATSKGPKTVDMYPRKGNPGASVQRNFSKAERDIALEDFYRNYEGGRYYPAYNMKENAARKRGWW